MNNKIEVIGIDHGWSNMKTSSQVFTTGVKEITTEPALFDGVLEYKGKYYKVGSSRQEVRDTKTEDESFYLLTLAAVAKELKRRGILCSGCSISAISNERDITFKECKGIRTRKFQVPVEKCIIQISLLKLFRKGYFL